MSTADLRQVEEAGDEYRQVLGVEDLAIFGGYVMDSLFKGTTTARDIDLAVRKSELCPKDCAQNLERRGCSVIEQRQYFININDPVELIIAQHGNAVLDVAFLDEFESIGQFDIESVYWQEGKRELIDRHDAVGAFARQTMRPIRGLDQENPYLLLNRMMNICSKYGFSIEENDFHNSAIAYLLSRIKTWQAPNDFHGIECVSSFYSCFLKSILRSENRAAFLTELHRIGVIRLLSPELHDVLSKKDPTTIDLQCVRIKAEAAELFMSLLPMPHKVELLGKLQLVSARKWDADDKVVCQPSSQHTPS